jgi:glyoxylase I family protein
MPYLCIDHPAISCQDVERQAAWYCKVFGMVVEFHDGKTPPSVLVGYPGDCTALELMPVRDKGPEPAKVPRFQPGLRHLAFRVSDFHVAYEKLKQDGVEFLFEPLQAVGGGMVVSFRDPEGNELQIVQREGLRPAQKQI